MKYWTEEEEKTLITAVSDNSSQELLVSIFPDRTWDSIRRKISRLGLRYGNTPPTYSRLEAIINATVSRMEKFKPRKLPKPKIDTLKSADHFGVLTLGDLHIGYINEYGVDNMESVRKDVDSYIKNTLHLLSDHARFEVLYVEILGDIVQGLKNYPEQVTESVPVDDQVPMGVELLVDFIDSLDAMGEQLGIEMIFRATPGNHGKVSEFRSTRRDNYDVLTYKLVDKMIHRVHGNVDFNWSRKEIREEVDGLVLFMEHGGDIRSYRGVPWYGIQDRILRLQTRNNDLWDVYSMGHVHIQGMWNLNNTRVLVSGTTQEDTELGDKIAIKASKGFWLVGFNGKRTGVIYSVDLRDR